MGSNSGNSSILTVISGGLQDFNSTEKIFTFAPSVDRESVDISIGLVDDEIDETEEGFLVVFSVDESASDSRDVANLQVLQDVTLAVIVDDDRKL